MLFLPICKPPTGDPAGQVAGACASLTPSAGKQHLAVRGVFLRRGRELSFITARAKRAAQGANWVQRHAGAGDPARQVAGTCASLTPSAGNQHLAVHGGWLYIPMQKTRVREVILGADASYRFLQPERSERPGARHAWGAAPADASYRFLQRGRMPAAHGATRTGCNPRGRAFMPSTARAQRAARGATCLGRSPP